MISFAKTVYEVTESKGFTEVCIELVEAPEDILENVVGPQVSVNDSSIYIPSGATLAS